MQSAFNQFNGNIKYVRDLAALHRYLVHVQKLPNDVSDILRGEWVITVSALDKLNHELIRTGMLQCFQGQRPQTAKFKAFAISMSTFTEIQQNTIPPPSYWFDQEIVQKHKTVSFQDPDKISDGLSLIWNESHKWSAIAGAMSMSESDTKTILKTIVSRRNQIVHESDIDLQTGQRTAISTTDTNSTIDFIERLGSTIFNLVK